MSLASDLLSVLGTFRSAVASRVNSGLLVTVDDHIAQLASVVDHDVTAAEDKARAIVGALYDALHGTATAVDAPAAPAAPVTPAAPVEAVPAPAPVEAAPAAVEASEPAPAAAEPAAEAAAEVVPNPTETAETPAAETAETAAS